MSSPPNLNGSISELADDLERVIQEASNLASSRRHTSQRQPNHGRTTSAVSGPRTETVARAEPDDRAHIDDRRAAPRTAMSAPDTRDDAGIVERRAAPRGRPTATLQQTWIDPAEMPFTPVVRPGSPLVSRALSMSATAVFILLLSWLIIPELNYRLSSLGTLVLRTGVLSAQPVQLSPSRASRVVELYVDPSSRLDSILPAGSPIARVEGLTRDGLRLEETVISAPFDARFASIDQLEGGVTFPGQPVATVYDPSRMYVIMTVQPETLELLRAGMKVKLKTPLLKGTISGTVISAIPLLGTDYNPTTQELVNVRIKPDVEKISLLIPGVRFSARIDLKSVPKDAPPLVFTSNVTATSDATPNATPDASPTSSVVANSLSLPGNSTPLTSVTVGTSVSADVTVSTKDR